MSGKRMAVRLWPAVMATVGLVLANAVLAGCTSDNVIGSNGPEPGIAASVNDETLTIDEVDAMVGEYCTLWADYDQATPIAKSSLREFLVQSWVSSIAVEHLADEAGIDTPEPTEQELESFWAELGDVDDDNREALADITRIQDLLRNTLIELGNADYADETDVEPSTGQAQSRALKLVAEWLSDQDVVINPAFGTFEDGQVQAGDDLSVPVTDLARQAQEQQPSPEFLAGLPAVQRCGPESAPDQVPLG